jgi:hypothetical protein
MYLDPEYDSGDYKGYAVVFYRKAKDANFKVKFDNQKGELVLKSPLVFELIDGESRIKFNEAALSLIDDKVYSSQAIYKFSIKNDAKFPKKGVFTIEGGGENGESISFDIDLTKVPMVEKPAPPVEETSD